MRELFPDEKAAYENIIRSKSKFGVFNKTCLHLHTPASYDYTLLKEWNDQKYINCKVEDIWKECLKRTVVPTGINLAQIDLKNERNIYTNIKEFLSFLLIANEIWLNDISVVVVTDHHRIDGAKKLEVAIQQLSKFRQFQIYPEVILGVEISCADRNHVVGIFDNNSLNQEAIKCWLEENLLDITEGSFCTSLEVLTFINTLGGIGYLAHLDTSDIFKEKFLNGAYKKKLLSDEVVKIIGLSSYTNKESIEQRMSQYRTKSVKYILDNDAHDIDSIGQKCFWIKGSKRTFSMVKEAFADYDIAVSFESQTNEKQYIKGIYIADKESGFLRGKDDTAFCVPFSHSLNCFIGGRGTGKSSSLKIMEYTLTQRCKSDRELDFICAHGNTWILYIYKNEEYLLGMRMPVKDDVSSNILQSFGQNPAKQYRYYYHFDPSEISRYAYSHFLEMNKVVHKDNTVYLEAVTEKRRFLELCFDRTYSINDLVTTASSKEISAFLYDTLFKNKTLAKASDLIQVRSKSGLSKILTEIKNVLLSRQTDVKTILDPFNQLQKGILKIVYSQDQPSTEPDIAAWVFGEQFNPSEWYQKKNIKQEDIIEYLLSLYYHYGIWEFLQLSLDRDKSSIPKKFNILSFCRDMTQAMVQNGIEALKAEDANAIVDSLLNKIITDKNISLVVQHLKKVVEETEEFSLEFNVNSKEGSRKAIYKDVRSISLGQKVVAMLSFILGYCDYSHDYRPLIIDQPEDNLDNQYIYQNLVRQLRAIKEKRQIIIATHNATIVTNAKAEQVCVMQSDNEHGWIEARGYPGELKIKKYILNYLEGGKDSFLHKIEIYNDALN